MEGLERGLPASWDMQSRLALDSLKGMLGYISKLKRSSHPFWKFVDLELVVNCPKLGRQDIGKLTLAACQALQTPVPEWISDTFHNT